MSIADIAQQAATRALVEGIARGRASVLKALFSINPEGSDKMNTSLIINILNAVLASMPEILSLVPIIEKLMNGTALTAEEHAALGKAMEDAHNAVQAKAEN